MPISKIKDHQKGLYCLKIITILDCWGGDSGGPIFIGSVAAGLLSTATYQGTWNSSMKGQGHCGGTAKPNGYMAYMSTDELYKEGFSLLYGQ